MPARKCAIQSVAASPSGKRFAAVVKVDQSAYFWFWTVSSWEAPPAASEKNARGGAWSGVSFRGEELIEGLDAWGQKGARRFGGGEDEALHLSGCLPAAGDMLLNVEGLLLDARTGQRMYPPAGRRYHPDLARFAPDGCLVPTAWGLVDVRADKVITTKQPSRHYPGVGFVAAIEPSQIVRSIEIPPELLELWAQVAVRGELGPDGSFAKWDEPTWDRKRRELAARPAPIPDFPFPGHVATDPLHWLRAEFNAADTEVERNRLARELLARAEANGDPEAARWRAELERHIAPPPREKQP